VTQRLAAWLLRPGSARRLGVIRLLFYPWTLFQLRVYEPWSIAQLPDELWDPVWLLAVFPAPSQAVLVAMSALLVAASLCACIGWHARAATRIAFALLVAVFGVQSSYGQVNIHFQPMILLAGVLAFAPCGDAVSLDARRGARPRARDAADYHWPIRLGQFLFVGLMFTAGCQKLAGNWLFQPVHNIEYWLRYKLFIHAKAKGIEMPGILHFLVEQPWLVAVMVIPMVCEVVSPLALVDRWPRLRFAIVGTLFAMQLALALVLKTLPSFPWLVAYLFFVPWDRILDAARRASRR